ncbi:hypothetical protein ABI59_13815 [Acidobacteria bacterium Mor1]|nr:hypothetical protein ABI59_13815 [Acidobacteria bacterium Mor1]
MLFSALLLVAAGAQAQERLEIIKDVNPGPEGSRARPMASDGDILYFAADDGVHGLELWKTDLSDEGTVLVRDIHPGTGDSVVLNPFRVEPDAATLGNLVFFIADDGVHGPEVWRSDGTAEGTWMLRDILDGEDGADPDYLTAFRGRMYFVASDRPGGTRNREIWSSDGTPEGTTKAFELNPSGSADPTGLTVIGDMMYFAGKGERRPTCATCLWRTDGTLEGTEIAAAISTGASNNAGRRFTHVDGTIYLSGATSGSGEAPNHALWTHNTQTGESARVAQINPDGFAVYSEITPFDGGVIFRSNDGSGVQSFRSDGTPEGTVRIGDPFSESGRFPVGLTVVGDRFFYRANTGSSGTGEIELHVSDGTTEGSMLVRDLRVLGDSFPSELTAFRGLVYFRALACRIREPNCLNILGDNLSQAGLWISDGTSEGTRFAEGQFGQSLPYFLTRFGNELIVQAQEPEFGPELYRYFPPGGSTTEVDIDVKPATTGNCVAIDDKGTVPVAVLGSAELDVSTIEIDSLRFEGLIVATNKKGQRQCRKKYVDGDDWLDLACFYEDDLSRWSGAEPEGTLSGQLEDGTPIEGTDALCLDH